MAQRRHAPDSQENGDVVRAAYAAPDPSERLAQLQRSVGSQGLQRMLSISGAPQVPQQSAQAPGQTQPVTGSQAQPFTAVFSMAMHGSRAHSVCGIPEKRGCVVKWAKWRLIDAHGAPVMGKVTVDEKFTKVNGPDDVFKRLKEQSNQTERGFFDDCYGLCVPDDYPPFSLEVEQHHLVGGHIVSRNLITYSPSGILIRVCTRSAQGFGPPCRRF